MNDYSHQCRYCAYCVFTMHETWWCDELHQSVNNPKRPNKCEKLLFNEISADDLNKVYKPRRKSPFVQDKLFEMPTDKQKENRSERSILPINIPRDEGRAVSGRSV